MIPRQKNKAGTGGVPDAQYLDPSTGTWHIRFSGGTHETRTLTWGIDGDIPWGGYSTPDQVIDEIVYRPSTGVFYVRGSASGGTTAVQTSGTSTDIPVH